ncbi:MAG: hypothetical protein V4505_25390 [Pseudomonadota bacterium]
MRSALKAGLAANQAQHDGKRSSQQHRRSSERCGHLARPVSVRFGHMAGRTQQEQRDNREKSTQPPAREPNASAAAYGAAYPRAASRSSNLAFCPAM